MLNQSSEPKTSNKPNQTSELNSIAEPNPTEPSNRRQRATGLHGYGKKMAQLTSQHQLRSEEPLKREEATLKGTTCLLSALKWTTGTQTELDNLMLDASGSELDSLGNRFKDLQSQSSLVQADLINRIINQLAGTTSQDIHLSALQGTQDPTAICQLRPAPLAQPLLFAGRPGSLLTRTKALQQQAIMQSLVSTLTRTPR